MDKEQIVDVVNAMWLYYEFGKSKEQIKQEHKIPDRLTRIGIKLANYLKSIEINSKKGKNES